jgi:hypothetical protein
MKDRIAKWVPCLAWRGEGGVTGDGGNSGDELVLTEVGSNLTSSCDPNPHVAVMNWKWESISMFMYRKGLVGEACSGL